MRRRSAYTLLEVLLSLAIAVLLLGALYSAIGYQLRQAQAGRELVSQAALSRAVFNRMGREVAAAANLPDPARFRNTVLAPPLGVSNNSSGQSSTTGGSGSTGSGSAGGTSGGSAGGSTAGGSSAGGSGSSASSSSTTTSTTATQNTTVYLSLGVTGDASTLNLTVSRVPTDAWPTDANATPTTSDLRRISYWVAGDGGLYRKEMKVVTSQDALDVNPPTGEDPQYLLAPEVKSVEFSYFDGTNWQESWDSTQVGADGITPQGSPRAIAVKIGFVPPGKRSAQGKEPALKIYRHVIALAGANGVTPLQQPNSDNPAIAAQQSVLSQAGASGSAAGSTTGSASGSPSTNGN